MKTILLAAAFAVGVSGYALAQGGQGAGGGQGTSASPSLTQNPKGSTARDGMPGKNVKMTKKKKKSRM